MTEELLPLFCPRWFLNCYMKLLALIYPVSAALPIWGKLLIVILLCRFFLGHVSTLISSIASVMMIAIKIHLQSAVSALLCSKLVLTHLAAQLIIKKLFSCSLVAPYSSKSTEQRTTLWLFLIFFFFFFARTSSNLNGDSTQAVIPSKFGLQISIHSWCQSCFSPNIYHRWVSDPHLLHSLSDLSQDYSVSWMIFFASLFLSLSGLNQWSPNITCCAS